LDGRFGVQALACPDFDSSLKAELQT